MRIVVIGAGVGGLTAAAVLARAGMEVTVLEAHVYPGGCASTFYHQGYRFDAGATLAGGFYPEGPMERVAQACGIETWQAHPTDIAMLVHLPDGTVIPRRSGDNRWDDIQNAFGDDGIAFFRWQEQTADFLWQLALDLPPWPPQSLHDWMMNARMGLPVLMREDFIRIIADAFRPVSIHLNSSTERLRLFVDGQLLISAQATSERANALYGAAALDLPRRGVVHLEGGMGRIAETLAEAVRRHGGQVHYRQEVSRIRLQTNRPSIVETKRGGAYPADLILANLTPGDLSELLHEPNPPLQNNFGVLSGKRLRGAYPEDGWGAFVVYLGIDEKVVPSDFPLHHQILVQRPLGEGNSLFASLSPDWDASRAPAGQRAVTLSTHTDLKIWWKMYQEDRNAYEERKSRLTEKMLSALEMILPGVHSATRLVMPGTPVTFQRFTRRKWGWVGGFPQTNLFRTMPPRLRRNLWLVGDSIFPGQSTAAVALGGLRVARQILGQRVIGSVA